MKRANRQRVVEAHLSDHVRQEDDTYRGIIRRSIQEETDDGANRRGSVMAYEQYAVFLDPEQDEQPEDRRCFTLEPCDGELMVQVLGADQSATEFLTRDHFEELVANARRIMGWELKSSALSEWVRKDR